MQKHTNYYILAALILLSGLLSYAFSSISSGLNFAVGAPRINVAQAASFITNGLVAHYEFEEGTGLTVADTSGNGNTGTLKTVGWTVGKVGNGALSFDGVASHYVQIAATGSLNITGAVTVSAWVNPATTPATATTIFSKGAANNLAAAEHYILKTSTSGKLSFEVSNGTAVLSAGVSPGVIPQANTWYHVVGVYNGTDTVSLYINGALSATGVKAGFGTLNPTPNSFIGIGSDNALRPWNGVIDEVALYNRDLSAAEVQQLYAYTQGAAAPSPSPSQSPDPGTPPSPSPSPSSSPAAQTVSTYYIDFQNGNDANDGASMNTPWKHAPGDNNATGNAAAAVLAPGNTVIFKGGTVYVGQVNIQQSGTANNPITYRGNTTTGSWGSGKALFDLQNSYYHAFYAIADNYVTIENIDMYGARNVTSTALVPGGSCPAGQTKINRNGSDICTIYTGTGGVYDRGFIMIRGGDNWIIRDVIIHETQHYTDRCAKAPESDTDASTDASVPADQSGINLYGTASVPVTNVLIDNVEIFATGRDLIDLFHSSNITISNSDFGGINRGAKTGYFAVAMRIAGSSSNIRITQNRMHDGWQYEGDEDQIRCHAGDWIHLYGNADGTLQPASDPHNIVIDKNFLYNDKVFSYTHGTANSFSEDDVYDVTWRNNVIVNPHHMGIKTSQVVNFSFYNNTIVVYDPAATGGVNPLYIGTNTFANPNIKIKNNILARIGTTSSVTPIYHYGPSSPLESDNNIYYSQKAGNDAVKKASTGYTLTEWQQFSGLDQNSSVQDPKLVNIPSSAANSSLGDYRISALSIDAIGRGQNLAALFTDDKDNQSRGSSWDIGAYKFTGQSQAGGGSSSAVAEIMRFSETQNSTLSGRTRTITLTKDVPVGDQVAMLIGWEAPSSIAITAITDSVGNTWTVQGTQINSSVHQQALISTYLTHALRIGDTISVTWSGTSSMPRFAGALIGIKGRRSSNIPSTVVINHGYGLNVSLPGSTTGSNMVIVGIMQTQQPTIYSNSNWTQIGAADNFGQSSSTVGLTNSYLYMNAANTATYNPGGVLNQAQIWQGIWVAFSPADGSVPPPSPSPSTPPPSTPDTTAPVTSGILASSLTSSGATITWNTNEGATTQVEYGLTTAYGNKTALNSSYTTSHTQALTNLSANTLYHYRVLSIDQAGNVTVSTDQTFATASVTVVPPTTTGGSGATGGTPAGGGGAAPSTPSTPTTPSAPSAPSIPNTPSTPSTPTVPTTTTSPTVTSPFNRPLSIGTSGADVKELQKLLNTSGYTISTSGAGAPGNESTYFGPATEAALKRFQCTVFGICSGSSYGSLDQTTITLLTKKPTIPTPTTKPTTPATNYTFTRSLKLGMTGTDVKQLQIFLNNNGYTIATTGAGSKGNESTYFGPATYKALMKFQLANRKTILDPYGYTIATGFFGPATLKVVNQLQK